MNTPEKNVAWAKLVGLPQKVKQSKPKPSRKAEMRELSESRRQLVYDKMKQIRERYTDAILINVVSRETEGLNTSLGYDIRIVISRPVTEYLDRDPDYNPWINKDSPVVPLGIAKKVDQPVWLIEDYDISVPPPIFTSE